MEACRWSEADDHLRLLPMPPTLPKLSWLRVLRAGLSGACRSRSAATPSTSYPAAAAQSGRSRPPSARRSADRPSPSFPITLVVADPALQSDTIYAPTGIVGGAARADSLIGEALVGRAPEVHWVLPPELRKMARRAAGFVDDPDQMGQAVLRSPNMTAVPDPLRSSLRSLVAIAEGGLPWCRRRSASVPSRTARSGPTSRWSWPMPAPARSCGVARVRAGGSRPIEAIERRAGRRASAVRRPMTYDVTLIPGDGIGPEITAQTVKVLEATGLRFNWDEELAGVAAVEATGTPLPDATVESIRKNALALKGPLTTPVGTGFRSVNVGLRKEFELFANVRPARTIVPGGRFENVDIVLVRENLEGLYIGVEHFVAIGDDPRAVGESMAIVTRRGCERIIRYAFEYALKHGRRKVTIVHKANILKMVSGLFLEVGRTIAKEYEGRVESNDMIVDNTAMQLVMRPEQFDVMVTTNMFGDILSDEVSGLVGRAGPRAGRQHRDQGRHLRGGARQRSRHRREGDRQSLRPRCSPRP